MRASLAKSLPVIMYHYVNDCIGGTSVSPECFEEQCRVVADKGWKGISLAEAEAFLIDGEPLPSKSALFTFDDGYLDNFLFAAPLLRKYGHHGVMFAVADRLGRSDVIRSLDGGELEARVRNPLRQNSCSHTIRDDVFCTEAEAKKMDVEGVMAVASHGLSHTGVFTTPEFTGFNRPGDQKRTFYKVYGEQVWGMPSFRVGPGLANRAFLPHVELAASIRELVPQDYERALAFFSVQENVWMLERLVKGFGDLPGRYETDEEQSTRMWEELSGGKQRLEGILGHNIRTLCWPWGAFCDESLRLAREAGFELFTTVKEGVNPPGKPLAVHRFKGKAKNGSWLASRLMLYSRPVLGSLYARFRI